MKARLGNFISKFDRNNMLNKAEIFFINYYLLQINDVKAKKQFIDKQFSFNYSNFFPLLCSTYIPSNNQNSPI